MTMKSSWRDSISAESEQRARLSLATDTGIDSRLVIPQTGMGLASNSIALQRAPGRQPYITDLGKWYVLVGRGAPAVKNEGNVRFRQLVQARKEEYRSTKKHFDKEIIAKEIVATVRTRGGHFVRKIDSPVEAAQLGIPEGVNAYVEVDESSVLDKVKQALRDRKFLNTQPLPTDAESDPSVTAGRHAKAAIRASQKQFSETVNRDSYSRTAGIALNGSRNSPQLPPAVADGLSARSTDANELIAAAAAMRRQLPGDRAGILAASLRERELQQTVGRLEQSLRDTQAREAVLGRLLLEQRLQQSSLPGGGSADLLGSGALPPSLVARGSGSLRGAPALPVGSLAGQSAPDLQDFGQATGGILGSAGTSALLARQNMLSEEELILAAAAARGGGAASFLASGRGGVDRLAGVGRAGAYEDSLLSSVSPRRRTSLLQQLAMSGASGSLLGDHSETAARSQFSHMLGNRSMRG